MAAGDATAAVGLSAEAGWFEVEHAVTVASVATASKPPAIRMSIMIGLLFGLP
jgi:hypothetical protein